MFSHFRQVNLVENRNYRFVIQATWVGLKLFGNPKIFFANVFNTSINKMHQHSNALSVPQELKSQTLSLTRTFDQTRNINKHQLMTMPVNHAKNRLNSRERVIRYLWSSS